METPESKKTKDSKMNAIDDHANPNNLGTRTAERGQYRYTVAVAEEETKMVGISNYALFPSLVETVQIIPQSTYCYICLWRG